ncbi:MAG: VanZ family protein [Bacteroidetes bacterium]|nr:VanZ family protein [Bacteroidota bacterium]
MKPLTFRSFIPGIIWFAIVLTLICLPSSDIPEPKGWFEWMNLIRIDKLVHAGIFSLLAFLFMRPILLSDFSPEYKWGYLLRIALAVCIWGLTTELIQKFFVPSRQFDLVDWAADTIGALIALLFCRKVYAKYLRKNSN